VLTWPHRTIQALEQTYLRRFENVAKAPAKKKAKAPAAKVRPARNGTSSTKLVPLHDRIVIRPVVQEEVLASGIVIPDTAKEKPQQGVVIAVGPGRLDDNGKRIQMDVQNGDRVLYAKYTGQEVKIDQEELIVLAEKDILAKVQ
jgi:chaperonin GroES